MKVKKSPRAFEAFLQRPFHQPHLFSAVCSNKRLYPELIWLFSSLAPQIYYLLPADGFQESLHTAQPGKTHIFGPFPETFTSYTITKKKWESKTNRKARPVGHTCNPSVSKAEMEGL